MKTITLLLLLILGLQKFSKGTDVAISLRREGMSQRKSLFLGYLASIIEYIAAVVVAIFLFKMHGILPYAFCFVAGAVILVLMEELVPESQRKYACIDLVTMATMAGFTVMMILDFAME